MLHRVLATVLALATTTQLIGCVPLAGCGDGNPEPFVGTWELHRTLDTADPCPGFAIPAITSVDIDRDIEGFLVASPDLVGEVTYTEPAPGEDYGRLAFSLSESWGGATDVIVDYDLTDSGYAIMGVARAQVGACAYAWSIYSI